MTRSAVQLEYLFLAASVALIISITVFGRPVLSPRAEAGTLAELHQATAGARQAVAVSE